MIRDAVMGVSEGVRKVEGRFQSLDRYGYSTKQRASRRPILSLGLPVLFLPPIRCTTVSCIAPASGRHRAAGEIEMPSIAQVLFCTPSPVVTILN